MRDREWVHGTRGLGAWDTQQRHAMGRDEGEGDGTDKGDRPGMEAVGSRETWEGWRWSVERRGRVAWQGGSMGKESTRRGCMTAADRGWVGSRQFCGAVRAQCACERDEWQWDGGWRGRWQQDRERGSNRKDLSKERTVAERRAPRRQGECHDGRRERAVTVAWRRLRRWLSRSRDCSKSCSSALSSHRRTQWPTTSYPKHPYPGFA